MEINEKWVKRMKRAANAVRGLDRADFEWLWAYEMDRQRKEQEKLWVPKTAKSVTKL